MNKKSFLCLLAVCAMLFSLCSGALADTARAEAITTEEAGAQLELLLTNIPGLTPKAGAECLYTVTDLDRNGRLELIAALKETDCRISAAIAEVTEALDGAIVLEIPAELPSILTAEARAFADAETGGVHYLFDDTQMNGAAVSAVSTGSLMLLNGKLSTGKVSSVKYTEQRGLTIMEFADGSGKTISPDEYENLPAKLYKGAEESKVSFRWLTAAECTSAEVLKNSYAVFTGEQAAAGDAAALDVKVSASAAATAAEADPAGNEPATVTTTASGQQVYGSVEEAREALGIKDNPASQQSGETVVVKPDITQAPQTQTAANGQQIYSSVEEARQNLGIQNNSSAQQSSSSGITIVPAPSQQPQQQTTVVSVPTATPAPAVIDPSQSGQGAGSGSFASDTGTALNIYASYDAVTLGSNLVQVTVSASLSHSSLTARANTVSFNLGGDYGAATAPEINCSGGSTSTYLGSTTFTVPLAPGESKSLSCSVSWNFGGTYSGVSIAAVTANGTVYLSR